MSEAIQQIEQGLLALTEADFDLDNETANGIERLYDISDKLLQLPQPEQAIHLILHTMERFAESDLGAPGPLIHTLEQLPDYESHLLKSIGRKPTPLSLWALNRIINDTNDQQKKQQLLLLMKKSLTHPLASNDTKRRAEGFLKFQARA